ncbi:hypothetical protein [Kamptonema sp. UHCC 0994]|uniref:hypothetical protein n=1 Tax=Kamptonema sp. UHCC 0994 TaxID=3031329 RepID=UPI0023B931E3|nr:hypothetical protein [Kamptonema sp. UHCC 0994]MDF0551816.1 hypothetical protein [Kamptonema sp. UHCC 0994]
MEKLGKTLNIASRLPHFYDTKNVESLLYQFLDVFGYIIEQAETDLMAVMRAHYVNTATNEDSQGFIGTRKGDLDKIFTLYLEALGGTSQLIQVSDRFTLGSIKNVDSFLSTLEINTDEISQYLRKQFSSQTQNLLKCYQVNRANFDANSFKNLPQLAIAILVAKDPISSYLKTEIDPKDYQLLTLYDGSETVPQKLQEIILTLLNQQLENPYLYGKNKSYFQTLPLLESVKQLIAAPITHDNRQRLHRLLLEAAYPEYIEASNIPSKGEVEKALIEEINRFLEAYNSEGDDADSTKLINQNRLLLEATYPNELEKIYVPYRERLKGIIAILRQGAANRQGILDLVAANLGILGDSDAALAAKKQIRLEEFTPEITWLRPPNTSFGRLAYRYPLRLFQEFIVASSNPEPSEIEIVLEIAQNLPVEWLHNLRIVRLDTKEEIRYQGRAKSGDKLLFKRDQILLNGQNAAVKGSTPLLPIDNSQWRFEAEIVLNETVGLFDQQKFNSSTLGFGEVAVHLEMRTYKLNPGTFEVTIPWDIPGYSDKFDEAADHPRHQIDNIINHVKAAGVLAIISYEKIFQEKHDLQVRLTVERSPFLENHIAEEKFNLIGLKVPYPQGIKHELSDKLLTAGVFDYARFDWGDRFSSIPPPTVEENYHEMTDKFLISGIFDYTDFDSGNGFE